MFQNAEFIKCWTGNFLKFLLLNF